MPWLCLASVVAPLDLSLLIYFDAGYIVVSRSRLKHRHVYSWTKPRTFVTSATIVTASIPCVAWVVFWRTSLWTTAFHSSGVSVPSPSLEKRKSAGFRSSRCLAETHPSMRCLGLNQLRSNISGILVLHFWFLKFSGRNCVDVIIIIIPVEIDIDKMRLTCPALILRCSFMPSCILFELRCEESLRKAAWQLRCDRRRICQRWPRGYDRRGIA